MGEVIIRHYKTEDRSAVRKIACDTAFLGKPAEIFFTDSEILADFLTLYFIEYEPKSCFVAKLDGKTIAYLVGTKNTAVLMNIFMMRIISRLIIKSISRGAWLKKKNVIFIYYLFRSFFRGELRAPDFSKLYPATLHINVGVNFRHKGIGSKLIDAYLRYLIQEKISGVYLSTLSDKAALFFERQGFKLLYKSRRSYFRNILHRDIWCYTYGKRLRD